MDLLGIAHQNGLEEAAGEQTRAGLQDAGVGALGENDGLGVLLQGFDQLAKHIVFLQIIWPPMRGTNLTH